MKKTLLMTLFAFLSSQSVWPMEQTTSPELRLLAAVQQSDDALIKQLLTEGIDINAHIAESNDTTALHMAAFIGNAKIVKLLLDSNADANSIMLHEYTPLLLATENGHSDAVELLLRAGANSEYGDTEITHFGWQRKMATQK